MPPDADGASWEWLAGAGLSAPARRALEHAGLHRLEDLAAVSSRHVASQHGMGPKGVRVLRAALEQRGLSFADET